MIFAFLSNSSASLLKRLSALDADLSMSVSKDPVSASSRTVIFMSVDLHPRAGQDLAVEVGVPRALYLRHVPHLLVREKVPDSLARALEPRHLEELAQARDRHLEALLRRRFSREELLDEVQLSGGPLRDLVGRPAEQNCDADQSAQVRLRRQDFPGASSSSLSPL